MRDTKGDKKTPCAASAPKKPVDATDPKNWSDFETAVKACCVSGASGVGIALGDGLAGVDLDKCRDPKTGELEPWAANVVKIFDSYTEISPSGTGVKIFVKG